MVETRPPVAKQIAVGLGLLAVVALIAFLGSLATMPNTEGWYARVEKVPWDPPNAVFGPVWSILYALIAVAGFLVWRAGYRGGEPNAARGTLGIYAAQLVLNGLWTPIFFAGYPVVGEVAWWLALAVILALIACVVWLAISAAKWSRIAAWIMVPYLLWLAFATTLNAGIIVLN
ncbi:tryptophan-rich sensory protein [Leucobacter sp. CSA1]|uniref:Tryptophan-rich sensory protein n=1 Tax=Leucobacter chromiisoli TaxID=2796471 RepID=A0A934UU19_9MICO|nr:TspO/MBR family protein [Leucobacter chromiisoli]MBK0419029.1 tryptophan-rich sensory protein [Leucobacter chromiisoli]